MRVAIAENDLIYRAGLVNLLAAAEVEVACQADNGRELLDHLAGYLPGDLPDAVLLDIRMGGRADDGLNTAEIIAKRYPDVGIVLLSASAYLTNEFARRFDALGNCGRAYLLKEEFNDIEDVHRALNQVRRGKTVSDTPVHNLLRRRQPTIKDLLTPRELDVLRLLATGLSNLGIAAKLRIDEEDKVEYATRCIYTKLDIPRTRDHNPRVHAAIRWLQEEEPEGK